MIDMGTETGKTATFIARTLSNFSQDARYVALADGSICSREDLWEHLVQTLLNAVDARRMAKRPKKLRPKGPCASLADDPKDRARVLRDAYNAIAKIAQRTSRNHVVTGPPQDVEVAAAVHLTHYQIWRFRNAYPWFGWPPDPEAAEA